MGSRPLRWLRERRNEAIVIVFVATVLCLVGPNTGSELWLIYRWVFWLILVTLGWLVGSATSVLTDRVLNDPPLWAHLIIDPPVIAVGVSAALFGLQFAIGRPIPLQSYPEAYFTVWVVSVAVTGVAFLVSLAFAPAAPGAQADEGVPSHGPLDHRLPVKLRGAAILAINSEDHYLRIFTDRGDALVLMRIADAERALAGVDGLRVHRSWWVAREAVAEVARADGKLSLVLTIGRTAPVSRSYAPQVRAAGWA